MRQSHPSLQSAMRPKRPASRSIRVMALFGVVAVGLGACANGPRDDFFTTGANDQDGYRTRHPIVLTESAETLDVPVGQQSGVLTQRMAHTITVFAQDARRHGAVGITILVPSGSANEATASHMSAQVAAALAEGGFPRGSIARSLYQVNDGRAVAPLRVAYARVKAVVPHRCGVWPDSVSTNNFQNKDDWELGCATQANIAAMAANPEDLVTPNGEDPANGTRRTTIITKYEAGSQTKADTGAKGASVSDVQGGN